MNFKRSPHALYEVLVAMAEACRVVFTAEITITPNTTPREALLMLLSKHPDWPTIQGWITAQLDQLFREAENEI